MSTLSGRSAVSDEDLARAGFYRLLAGIFGSEPDEALLGVCSGLSGPQTPVGQAVNALATEAAKADLEDLKAAYFNIFIGVTGGELTPYASYYLTGFLHEKPLARLREDLAGLGVEVIDQVSEPEDHVSSIFEVMAGLCDRSIQPAELLGELGEEVGEELAGLERMFFEKHIANWAPVFCRDLSQTQEAPFYACAGRLGEAFLSVEIAALEYER